MWWSPGCRCCTVGCHQRMVRRVLKNCLIPWGGWFSVISGATGTAAEWCEVQFHFPLVVGYTLPSPPLSPELHVGALSHLTFSTEREWLLVELDVRMSLWRWSASLWRFQTKDKWKTRCSGDCPVTSDICVSAASPAPWASFAPSSQLKRTGFLGMMERHF